jgi:hypothetical protein
MEFSLFPIVSEESGLAIAHNSRRTSYLQATGSHKRLREEERNDGRRDDRHAFGVTRKMDKTDKHIKETRDEGRTEGRRKTEEGRIKDRGTTGRPLRPEHHAVQGFARTTVTPLA